MMTDNTCMVQVQEIKGLRADGGIIQFWNELFKHLLNKTAGVSLENFWTGILYCLFHINNLFKVYIYIEFFYCLR